MLTATIFRQLEGKNALTGNVYAGLLTNLSKGSIRIKSNNFKCLESQPDIPNIYFLM